ncbi:MAG: hypothetical protein LUI60_03670 [Clostridia bacterium]|nr:hypothetical protein [Clostridia bacterium]
MSWFDIVIIAVVSVAVVAVIAVAIYNKIKGKGGGCDSCGGGCQGCSMHCSHCVPPKDDSLKDGK